MESDVNAYNATLTGDNKEICDLLRKLIQQTLPKAESKVWHGAPVWFLESNPIVGYSIKKSHVSLLFWSGQSFTEPGLAPEGSFKAAEILYTSTTQVDESKVIAWLKESENIQWDYKNIVKKKGRLDRLK